MKILYLTDMPIPEQQQTDAVFQEIQVLRNTHPDTQVRSLSAFRKPHTFAPSLLLGLKSIYWLQKHVQKYDIVHLFLSRFRSFPVLNYLSNNCKLIITVLTPIHDIQVVQKFVQRGVKFFVSSQALADEMNRAFGANTAFFTWPPIQKIEASPVTYDWKSDMPFRMIMASAPWTSAQIESKGIPMLLQAVKSIPQLHLTLLWRNHAYGEVKALVKKMKLENRVSVINEQVDINAELTAQHTGVLLVQDAHIVKAYPHSLLECLAACKPVILTANIELSNFVKENNVGLIVDDFNTQEVIASIQKLMQNYDTFVHHIESMQTPPWTPTAFVSSIDQVYGLLY